MRKGTVEPMCRVLLLVMLLVFEVGCAGIGNAYKKYDSVSLVIPARKHWSAPPEAAWRTEREHFVALHAELEPPIKDAILENKLVHGMTKDQALFLLRTLRHHKHDEPNKHFLSIVDHDQWVGAIWDPGHMMIDVTWFLGFPEAKLGVLVLLFKQERLVGIFAHTAYERQLLPP
jgi:hypothetical protein